LEAFFSLKLVDGLRAVVAAAAGQSSGLLAAIASEKGQLLLLYRIAATFELA